jgi:hypothetical protein
MITLLHDYIYRFPLDRMHMAGRCRVRIFQPETGGPTVLLSELNQSPGESIASACDRIATNLVARWQLNPRTTRWLQQEATPEDSSRFDEVTFAWEDRNTATKPQWRVASDNRVYSLTGMTLNALDRRLGDPGSETEGG